MKNLQNQILSGHSWHLLMFGSVGLLFDSSQTGSRSTADGCPDVPMGLIGGHQDLTKTRRQMLKYPSVGLIKRLQLWQSWGSKR